MASSISAARAALFNLLEQAAAGGGALSGVQISWGLPIEYEEQDVICIGGITAASSDWETFTVGERVFEFGSPLLGKCHDPSGEPSDVEARALDLYEAIRVLIDADRTLGGAVVDVGLSEFSAEGVEGSPGRVLFFSAQVDCAVVVPV